MPAYILKRPPATMTAKTRHYMILARIMTVTFWSAVIFISTSLYLDGMLTTPFIAAYEWIRDYGLSRWLWVFGMINAVIWFFVGLIYVMAD